VDELVEGERGEREASSDSKLRHYRRARALATEVAPAYHSELTF
jgi:hypothetical protein